VTSGARVEDLGFSAQGEQIIAYSQRRLTARVSPAWPDYDKLYIRLFDEQGDRLSLFPKKRPSDDRRTYWRAARMWRHLRDAVRSRVEAHLCRLDAAITSRRSWPVARWRQLFLGHLIQRIAASILIWEYQAAPEAPWTRCTVTEEGECVNETGAPLELEPAGVLRLAHPAEMEAAALERGRTTHPSWYLLKYLWEHEHVGLQCWRPFTPLPEEERAARWHELAHPFALEYHHLRESGWLPGSETDEEPFTTLWKPLPSAGVTIVMQTRTRSAYSAIRSGIGIGCVGGANWRGWASCRMARWSGRAALIVICPWTIHGCCPWRPCQRWRSVMPSMTCNAFEGSMYELEVSWWCDAPRMA
jgi:hypothetical protein